MPQTFELSVATLLSRQNIFDGKELTMKIFIAFVLSVCVLQVRIANKSRAEVDLVVEGLFKII